MRLPESAAGAGTGPAGDAPQASAGAGLAQEADGDRSATRRRRRARAKAAGLGRSRRGLSSKILHAAVDTAGLPLVFVLTPGQAADNPQFQTVLGRIRVPDSLGRPRTRPGAVATDKAYSSKAHRAYLRRRGITAVIPEKVDQAANRRKRTASSIAPPARRQSDAHERGHRGPGRRTSTSDESTGPPGSLPNWSGCTASPSRRPPCTASWSGAV
ncbi:transposase [Streptomyces globisporus]|uniref:transposase n=1 Tax=Streptomyces globisporus TaxID=1908 RepID=UPI0037FE686A